MKQMRQTLTCILAFLYLFIACKEQAPLASIEKGFREIPDSIRTGCYWYWLSDNISKEGVIKDLHAMKKAGITRTYIGNIGLDNIPYGTVRIFTPEWWEAIHTALKTATELDIEIGMFNSPGWSQSGGPWVKPEQAMRYLAATDRQVKGPQTVSVSFPETPDNIQLVRVIAYPIKTGAYAKSFNIRQAGGAQETILMPVDGNQTIRSLQLSTQDYFHTTAELQAKDGEGYKTIRRFEIDRTNYQLNVGFDPYAPIAVSLPETKASEFRLLLGKPLSRYGTPSATVTLSSEPVTERYPEQSLAKMFQRPLPYWHVYMWEKQDWYDRASEYTIPQDQVTDITAFLSKDGVLKWDVPDGTWNISLLEMKTTGVTNAPATPDATGLEVDKMSRKHVAAHFDAFMGEILRRVPEADRKSLKVAVQDSYETGGQNWTDDMFERFKETYGYDALPYLPTLQGKVVGNEDISSRFLWDLRRLVADRVAYDYVGGLAEMCHQHGLTTWLENYG
ncbi:MAG: glycoside hydrolase family 2, partial [Tannerella sp.]|nr:glycoside hydrolase family 2 [Tannerella sp.]